MSRLKKQTFEDIKDEGSKEILQGIKQKLGFVPNIFLGIAHSPAVLKAYADLSGAEGSTSLSPRTKELIALAVAEENHCDYCLSAHSFFAKNLKIDQDDILKARKSESNDPKIDAILKFVRKAVQKRGKIDESDLENLKKHAQISDQEITEIVLSLVVNMFTNYFNNITGTEIDFPKAENLQGARS